MRLAFITSDLPNYRSKSAEPRCFSQLSNVGMFYIKASKNAFNDVYGNHISSNDEPVYGDGKSYKSPHYPFPEESFMGWALKLVFKSIYFGHILRSKLTHLTFIYNVILHIWYKSEFEKYALSILITSNDLTFVNVCKSIIRIHFKTKTLFGSAPFNL